MRNMLRYFLAALAFGVVSASGPAKALLLQPNPADFTFVENFGDYQVTNNSSDWYLYGLIVTNANASPSDLMSVLSNGPNFDGSHWVSSVINYPQSPAHSYFNNTPGDFESFVGPGQTGTFFFSAEIASQPTLYLVDAFGNATAQITLGVPETSTWVMLIMGFAGVGFMAYRRRYSSLPAMA